MYEGTTVIDIHGHMSAPPEFRGHGYSLISTRAPQGARLNISEDRLRRAADHHLEMMNERGIDVQLISPRPVSMMHWERPYIVHNWTTNTNDVIKQLCDLEPTRWLGVAQLPQSNDEDTSYCIDEFDRCVNELGFVGAMLNPDPGANRECAGVNNPYWFPLYEKSIELEAPLIVHASISRDPRLDPLFANYQYNFTTEEALAVQLYRQTDVFDRYPGLRIIVCHCGGALERTLVNGQRTGSGGGTNPEGGGPRRDTSANLFIDSCAYDPVFLAAAIKQWGVDQVLFGTEAPGTGTGVLNTENGKASDDLIPVLDSFEWLSTDDKLKILRENALRVFPRIKKSVALAGR